VACEISASDNFAVWTRRAPPRSEDGGHTFRGGVSTWTSSKAPARPPGPACDPWRLCLYGLSSLELFLDFVFVDQRPDLLNFALGKSIEDVFVEYDMPSVDLEPEELGSGPTVKA
jgi:hypothetical protein